MTEDLAFTSTEEDLELPDDSTAMLLADIIEADKRLRERTDELNTALRQTVAAARMMGLSFAEIGKALGVSRQAAWERFSKDAD